MCCSPWGHKESDTTERLNNNNLSLIKHLLMLHPLLWPSYQGNSISSKPDQEWSSLWTPSGNLLLCIMLHLHWFSLRAHSKISSLWIFMYLLLCPQIVCAFFPVYLCVWPISALLVTGAVLCQVASVVSVHGILQARILECAAMPSSRGFSQSRHGTYISYISRWVLYH